MTGLSRNLSQNNLFCILDLFGTCHSGENRNPEKQTGVTLLAWIPAYAGMPEYVFMYRDSVNYCLDDLVPCGDIPMGLPITIGRTATE